MSLIDIVQNALGAERIEVLTEVFNGSIGLLPPGVKSSRFRADNPQWMNVLDDIGTNGLFLTLNKEYTHYRVKALSLPLIDHPHAKDLLGQMEKAFVFFKEEYPHNPDETSFTVDETAHFLNMEYEDVQEMYCYMKDVSGWYVGIGVDFPLDDSFVTIGEEVLKHDSFMSLIERVYSWNYTDKEVEVVDKDSFSEKETNWNMVAALIALASLIAMVAIYLIGGL